jgi:hypothetical protein
LAEMATGSVSLTTFSFSFNKPEIWKCVVNKKNVK